MTKEDLESTLKSRARKCIELANNKLDIGTFFIAGSCIATNEINDIDIFFDLDTPFPSFDSIEILQETNNAITIKNSNNPVLQYCRYKKASLKELVESFDFSHVQAGVKIVNQVVEEVFYTEAFLYSNAAKTSIFTDSDYPLSSLVRLLKYYKREDLTKSSSIASILLILTAIVERGFKSYEDFKDQLDAVDLGLVPEDLESINRTNLTKLYSLLLKNPEGQIKKESNE